MIIQQQLVIHAPTERPQRLHGAVRPSRPATPAAGGRSLEWWP